MLLTLLSWWFWLLFEPLSLVLALLPTPSPAPPSKQVSTATLRDGRKLAYEVRGSLERQNKIFWNHGIISSRYEVMSTDLGVLEELDIVLIGIDRPSYGWSDSDPDRSYKSYADDLAQVADQLGWDRFFVAGVSGGGPYTFAAAHYLSERVRGAMTISTLAPPDKMSAAEEFRSCMEMDFMSNILRRLFRNHRFLGHLVKEFSQGLYTGRVMYHAFLRPLSRNALSLMAEVDRRCLLEQHTEYMSLIVPEGLRQKTAECFFEDLWLFDQPWDFDLESISPELQAAIHIWHGTGDRQIPWVQAEVLKRLLPGAHLHIEEGGGHFAYYVCSKAAQKRALQLLLDSAVPPAQPESGALSNGTAGSNWKKYVSTDEGLIA